MIPILVVTGPTAGGKTRLAVDLALKYSGEVVGADSMQVYKGMDIASAKPTPQEQRGIPHHLIDYLEPSAGFSVADYVKLARQAIAGIRERGNLPVLCGGTGLYISSLIDNISFERIETDAKTKAELKKLPGEALYGMLAQKDPELAEKLHPNNRGRVIRALEVIAATGEKMSALQKRARQGPGEYDACIIGLNYKDREKLYERINRRVDGMLEAGLLDEAKNANNTGTAAQAIGHKELGAYFAGEKSLDACVEALKQATRNYAKRQITWFKRDERIRWLYADDYEDYRTLLQTAIRIVGEHEWEESQKNS